MHSKWLICIAASVILAPLVVSAAGDPVRGKQLAAQCFACHGEDGNSPSPVVPRIGGQHEQYLLLSMQSYADSTRPDSLMSGAVLDKSEQDLMDMAAYFAGQNPAPTAPPGGGAPEGDGGPRGPRGPGAVMQFNHGERDSEFVSMLARVRDYESQRIAAIDIEVCSFVTNDQAERDNDNDGLADGFDSAPDDPDEFVADRNGDGYYEICSMQQLAAIATLGRAPGSATGLTIEQRRARSYQLVRDVDAAGVLFEPIGDCGPTGNCMRALGQFGYSGVFDGRGHTIRNLRINAPERGGVGLFGVLGSAGVVMAVRLENVSVTGRAGVGAVVGSNFGTIYRCSADGTTKGMMAVGGMVGGSGGMVYGAEFTGIVDAKQAAGGLVGDMTGAVFNSRADAQIAGVRGIGGLVGLNTFGSVLDSNASGSVSGSNDIGGLIGVNTDAKVRNSFATGAVNGVSNNIGGLVGFNSQSIVRNAFATGNVSGADGVGGLVGRNKGIVANGFATGETSGAGTTGPVVGIVVEGEPVATFARETDDLGELTGQQTGWAPADLPVDKPIQYFCDSNGNGYIDPDERRADNYIWQFDGELPSIRCQAVR